MQDRHLDATFVYFSSLSLAVVAWELDEGTLKVIEDDF